VVAACVLFALLLLSRTPIRAFAPLLALLVGTGAAALMANVDSPPALLGEVPAGLPTPAVPVIPVTLIPSLLLAAVGVLLVAYADFTLTGRSFHQAGEPELVPQTELRALSLVNVAAGLFRGMPVSTSGSRSAVARAAGATSQGYSIAAAGFLAIVLLVAGPVLEVIPQAALGALVIYAAFLLIDVAGFRRLWRFRRSEFWLAMVTAAGVLVFGVLYGVLVAVAVSVLLLMVEVARPHAAALGFVPDMAGMHDIDDFPNAYEEPGLLIFRYDSPLIFANAEDFLGQARSMIADRPGTRWFALQSEAIIEIDSTGVDALITLSYELRMADVRFVLVRAKSDLLETLQNTPLLKQIGPAHVFPTLPTLVAAYRSEPR
jgi:MFS superfamily sulfate permease-like transporter